MDAPRAASGVEKDLMALADLGKVGAGDDVARGEFGIGMDGRHEALACLVDEDGAFAAEGLGGEGPGSAPVAMAVGWNWTNSGSAITRPPGRHAHGVAAHAGGLVVTA